MTGLCIISMILVLVAAGPVTAEPELYVSPRDAFVLVDDEFQLSVVANSDVVGLMGYNVVIGFDPAILELLSVDEGTLPGSGGAETFFFWFGAGAPADTAHVNGAVLGTTVDGSGVLFTLTFKAKTVGLTQIEFVYSEIRDGTNADIAHTTTYGEVQVDESIPVKTVTWGEVKRLYK